MLMDTHDWTRQEAIVAEQRKVGNLLALVVLSYLSAGPTHPYELSRTLRSHDDARSVKFNHGSLYMVFRQLAEAELIVARETSRDGQRPERTVYALTDTGREEMRDWLRDLVERPRHEYPQFVAALSLIGALRPKEAVRLLKKRLERLAEQRAEIRSLIDRADADGLHPLFVIEEDYRLALADAEIEFVERFIERIDHPRSGWARDWTKFHKERA